MNKLTGDELFEEIFHRYYSPLCNYALKIVGSAALAEDLVQQLFLQLYEKEVLSKVTYPERYLLRCVKFKCIDYHRTKRSKKEIRLELIPDGFLDQSSDISEEDIEPLLHYFASKLPPKTREVFLLSRDSGMTYKEIAQELNISVKTVEAQMGRALRQMRALLKAHNFLSLIPFL